MTPISDPDPKITPPRISKTLLLAGAAFLLVLGWALARSIRHSLAFTSAGWKHPDTAMVDGLSVRQRMLSDFLGHHRLQDMPRDSVLSYLGEPNHEGYFHDWDLAYWLGPEHSLFGMDSEWLVIRFDSGGRVVEHAIRTD